MTNKPKTESKSESDAEGVTGRIEGSRVVASAEVMARKEAGIACLRGEHEAVERRPGIDGPAEMTPGTPLMNIWKTEFQYCCHCKCVYASKERGAE